MSTIQIYAGFFLLAGFAALALPLLRRRLPSFPRTAAKMLEVKTRVHLTPQHSVHVLEFQGRWYLISASPGGCQLLAEAAEPLADAAAPSVPGGFQELLRRAASGGRG